MNEKINEISNKNLIELFCIINAFNIKEIEKGNEYNKGWIKIKYIKEMSITEYINIFKLVRIPILYDFVKYFKEIEEKFENQNVETKINVNDYIQETQQISQEIIIEMVFDIKCTIEEIEEVKKALIESIKINKVDVSIFKILK